MMQTFDETAFDTLIWYKPDRVKRQFELRREHAVVGTLTFDPGPAVAWEYTARHPASATAADGTWRLTVVRRGFLGLKADVHVQGTNSGVLEAGYLLRRGTLTMSEMPDHQWFGGIAERSFDSPKRTGAGRRHSRRPVCRVLPGVARSARRSNLAPIGVRRSQSGRSLL